jgi:hypothetical protein
MFSFLYYALFLSLFISVALLRTSKNDVYLHYMASAVKGRIVNLEWATNNNFLSIDTIDDFWTWATDITAAEIPFKPPRIMNTYTQVIV